VLALLDVAIGNLMSELSLEEYKNLAAKKLNAIIENSSKISDDNYSFRFEVSENEPMEFKQAFSGLNNMIAHFHDIIKNLENKNFALEKKLSKNKDELHEVNNLLFEDIAERKRTEVTLFEQEKFLSEIFSCIQDPISILDRDLNIVRVNKTMEKWYPEKMPLTGKKCYWVYHNRNTPCENCPSLKTLTLGTPATEVVLKCDSYGNSIGYVELNTFAWKEGSSGKVLGVIEHVRDISERRKLEAELFKVKKLESLGVLAGGIAHDFNNILTGIVSNLFIVKGQVASNPDAHHLLTEAEKACFRAGKLVKQLLTFSKGGNPIKELVFLNEIIEDTIEFCLSGSSVNANLQLGVELLPVEADRVQIDQVFNNLIINAIQAMPGGGNITITTENIEITNYHKITDESLAKLTIGKYVKVTVEDQGNGISHESMEKIFDPYFTTKSYGTGLGLTIVYSIVNHHQGIITLSSEINRGTIFTFYLPAAKNKYVSHDIKGAIILPFITKCHILVMDDDLAVRVALEKLLVSMGCAVYSVSKGEDAIEAYRVAIVNKQPFDLVIMDLTIRGGMGGKDAVGRILSLDPGAKVIVTSGYSSDPIISDFANYGFYGALLKPFQYEELVAKINIVHSKN
jgi:PAS domain S-box-containing protein